MHLFQTHTTASMALLYSTLAVTQSVPTIPLSTTRTHTPLLTHTGPFTASPQQNPTLAFYQKYTHAIENIDLATMYPDWYALNSTFYNGNGTFYIGGPSIKTWIEGLFGPFSHIEINHHSHRVFSYESSPAVGDEGGNNAQDAINQVVCGDKCSRLLTEHDMVFFLKGNLSGPGIPVRRAMSWVLGPAQVEGQGTDGLQWYEGRVWWDTQVLTKEIGRRQAMLGVGG